MNVDRRKQIVDLITQQHTVKNNELMERFNISIETVRRDLKYLEQQGYLKCVYGGAELNMALGYEPEYSRRLKNHHQEKSAIAAEAAKLISPGDSIYLGVGTTVEAITQQVNVMRDLTVFTNALRTAISLVDIPGCSVFMPGGQLRSKELVLSGFPSEENFSHFNIDKAFIGIGGITEMGVTDYHIGEAKLHKCLIDNAKQTIILSDSSKFGVRAMTNVCSLKDIDIVVTDSNAPADIVASIEKAGVRVIIAEV